jgi:hypothetical protein
MALYQSFSMFSRTIGSSSEIRLTGLGSLVLNWMTSKLQVAVMGIQDSLGTVIVDFVRIKGSVLHFMFSLFLLTSAFYCLPSCMAAGENKQSDPDHYTLVLGPSSKKQRVLSFPKDYSIGWVVITTWPPSNGSIERRVKAQGTVIVPAGKMVKFIPGDRCYKEPSILKTLSADSFDSIQMLSTSIYTEEADMCDRVLLQIGHLKGLLELDLNNSDATDKGVAYAISQLHNLQILSAVATALDGKFLTQIDTLKRLHSLTLTYIKIPDDNLRYIAGLPRLEHLHIGHCRVSDRGIENLASCSRLIDLNLSDNPKITDHSIKIILSMKDLRFLMLDNTSITTAGILQLKPLPLFVLGLPSAQILRHDSRVISKVFPGIHLGAPKDPSPNVDPDTGAVFAPLH